MLYTHQGLDIKALQTLELILIALIFERRLDTQACSPLGEYTHKSDQYCIFVATA